MPQRTVGFLCSLLTSLLLLLRKSSLFFTLLFILVSSCQFYVWETSEYNLSFHSSLIGEVISGSSEVTSKCSSSVRLGLGNNEAYPSGYESM